MKIIQPSYEILTSLENSHHIIQDIEAIGRTCYKSEAKINPMSASKFVTDLVTRKHHAMIEFFDIVVRFIHNRGFTHEMVRHRLCSFAQESTRYCDYEGGLTVIEPFWMKEYSEDEYLEWFGHMNHAEVVYRNLKKKGLSPQEARGVLPIDIKTEIVVKCNLREWSHIFDLRCSSKAHPDMRRVMLPLQKEFQRELPEIFGEIK